MTYIQKKFASLAAAIKYIKDLAIRDIESKFPEVKVTDMNLNWCYYDVNHSSYAMYASGSGPDNVTRCSAGRANDMTDEQIVAAVRGLPDDDVKAKEVYDYVKDNIFAK